MLASLVVFAALGLTAAMVALVAFSRLRGERRAGTRLRLRVADLEARAALLDSTLENIGEGLSVFDRDGHLIIWNSRMMELLELSGKIGPEKTLRDVLTVQVGRGDFGEVDPETEVAERLERFYREVPTVKERVTATGRILQLRRRPMPQGRVLTVYSDITEIKASERRLIHARSQAELANRAKGDFLANMSHELRTPLNAIIGFSEVIANEIFGPIKNTKYVEYLKDIHDSSLHLLSIINDVLDMAKIEAGRIELCKEAVNVGAVLGDAVRMLQKRAAANDIEFVTELPADDIVFWADQRAIKQVLLNLLANAVKFSKPQSRVYIRVVDETPGSIAIEVEDQGIGMTEEEQLRALQPFGQAKAVTTRNYGGTGLGLSITKGLVEAHHGRLMLASRPGEGTRVRISLPMPEAWLASERGKPPVAIAAS
ncbi:MAG TPA: ATP-binding protein [Stellaceae bacterium]|nr:ATP-binding protein [Stellaceae bacterium]